MKPYYLAKMGILGRLQNAFRSNFIPRFESSSIISKGHRANDRRAGVWGLRTQKNSRSINFLRIRGSKSNSNIVLQVALVLSLFWVVFPVTLTASNVIRVGVRADVKPMGFIEQEERKGFDVDVAKMIIQRLSKIDDVEYRIEFETVNLQDRFDKIHSNQVNWLVATVSITEERSRMYRFSDPYFNTQILIISNKGKTLDSLDDLFDIRVGALKNSTIVSYISQIPSTEILLGDTIQWLQNVLKENTVQAIALDSTIISRILQNKKENYVTSPIVLGRENYGIVFNKKTDSSRIEKVNGIINEIVNDGTIHGIAAKYGLPYQPISD